MKVEHGKTNLWILYTDAQLQEVIHPSNLEVCHAADCVTAFVRDSGYRLDNDNGQRFRTSTKGGDRVQLVHLSNDKEISSVEALSSRDPIAVGGLVEEHWNA